MAFEGMDGISKFTRGFDAGAAFLRNTQSAADAMKTQTEQVIGKQLETTEVGDDLLTANFYNDMGVHITTRPQSGSLEELASLQNINASSGVGRTDRKEAFNAVSDPLTRAYMYAPISENTVSALSALDGGEFSKFMVDDLLGDVVVSLI